MDWGDFSGGYTVSPGTQSEYGPSTGATGADGTTDDDNADDTGTDDGTVGPDDAYAPGVGQQPAGTGGGTGGTGGTGGGTSGGVSPG
jgi:hypothetical protein